MAFPSQARLNRLGLSSLQVVSDDQGSQVRGQFFFRYSYDGQVGDTLTTTLPFSGFYTDGIPLSYDPPTVFPVNISDGLGPFVDTDGIETHTGESNVNFSINDTPTLIVPPVFTPPTFNFPTWGGFSFP